jgi:GWxTD domain-containing protein
MVWIGLTTLLLAAAEPSRAIEIPPLRPESSPFFTADLVLSLDGEGRPAMGVSVSVPYQGLQWIRLEAPHPEGRYAAGVEVAVSFVPRRASRLVGDVWERRLVVGDYDGTRSPRAIAVERRTFEIPPGRYDVAVTLRDLNAGTESRAEEDVMVPDYSKVPVGFADLELGVTDSAGVFRGVPTRMYGVEARRLAARATLFDRRGGEWPRRYRFKYRILDDRGEEMHSGITDATLMRSAEPVVIGLTGAELFVGLYTFEVELSEGRSRWRVNRTFEVEESGPPQGVAFERMLEALSYIASEEEMEGLRGLPVDQQALAWERFWRRRDPTPDTPRNEALIEFIRRLRHAERHFQGFGPGWRSDMGRIYIRYGPPDQVESRPVSSEAPQLEIWYYHNPYRRFVFADREGFGRYTLLSPVGE